MIYLDYETYSECPISSGAYNYASHPSTKILLVAYKIDKNNTRIYEPATDGELPEDLKQALSRGDKIVAWNAQFEYYITKFAGPQLGLKNITLKRFIDAMAISTRFGYPLSLDKAGKAIGLPEEKQKLADGKRLIKLFCLPDKNGDQVNPADHPEKWARFKDYGLQDVDTMVEILHRLPGQKMQDQEQAIWELDTLINSRGVKIDQEIAEKAVRMMEETKARYQEEIAKLTGGAVTTGQQVARMLEWMQGYGVHSRDLTKESVQDLLKTPYLPGPVKRLLELRILLSKSSVSKYERMLSTVSDDSRIRGLFQYNGAYRTGRWGGRGVQPHSLPRGQYNVPDEDLELIRDYDIPGIEKKYDSVAEMLSSSIRQVFTAEEGHHFHIVDYSGIENRVVAWLAEDDKLIARFINKVDQYKLMAGKIFRKDPEEVTKDERFIGKQVILGCGYSMGGKKFADRMQQLGVDLSHKQADHYVDVYRQEHPKITRLWYALGDAMITAIQHGKSSVGKVQFVYTKKHLFVILPNGKQLCFPQVALRLNRWDRQEVTYMQEVYGKWCVSSTYGAKLLENLAQAISRELLAEAMVKLEASGFPVVMHVHDEIVCEVPVNSDKTLEAMEEIMISPNQWAKGLPLDVEGFTSRRYRK